MRSLVLFAFAVAATAQVTITTPPFTPYDPNALPVVEAAPGGFTEQVPLWPAGKVPGAVGTTPADVPMLYTYPATGKGPHAAVIVIPGGGYTHLVTEKEGGVEARWLQAHGVSAYVLIYRLAPRYRFPAPLEDGARAVRFVRAHAVDWHLRTSAIGVWGFSAGGHMAGYLATMIPDAAAPADEIDHTSAHPDFTLISYGRVDLDPRIPGTFGMAQLTGPGVTKEQEHIIDPVLHVTANTSPALLYSTEHDEKVNPLNATLYYNALLAAGVSAELHLFEQGPHGTHMGDDQPRFPELAIYPTIVQNWMTLHGWMEPQRQ